MKHCEYDHKDGCAYCGAPASREPRSAVIEAMRPLAKRLRINEDELWALADAALAAAPSHGPDLREAVLRILNDSGSYASMEDVADAILAATPRRVAERLINDV